MKNPRLLIAGIIMLVGLFTYFGNKQVNPVTGEKQHVNMTTKQEVALGMQSAPQMAEQMGGLDPDPELQAAIKRIGERIVSRSKASGTDYQFQFHLLRDTKTVNAFALPGGPVFITRALLDQLSNEAQVAGVLGHEIGHVVARHSAEHIAKSQLAQSMVGAVGVAASDEGGRGQQAAMMAAFVAQMAQLKYGRSDELESDRLGVQFMSQAGYDPRALLDVMKVLEKASGGSNRPEWSSSHPNPGNRQQQINAAIKELYPNGVPAELELGAGGKARSAGAGSF